MDIVRFANQQVMDILGEPEINSNINYKMLSTCLIEEINGGKLILNGLTRAIVFIKDNEFDQLGDIRKYSFLYKYYFFVPESFNEISVIDQIREVERKPIDELYLDSPTQFTILTTTMCNARCEYCYETPMLQNKRHMSKDTALKVAKYIDEHAPQDMQINIAWFGGEPLFNMKVIDIIDEYLTAHGRTFTNTMTTNGYLFNKDLVQKAVEKWNLVNVQISIDGTEEHYNRIKNYIYNNGLNPYKKVLNNIATLLNNNIEVGIRLNMDKKNVDNLIELVKEIKERFGNHPMLSVYTWPIFTEDGDYDHDDETYNKLQELEGTIISCGYFCGLVPKDNLKWFECIADSGSDVLISPSGDLGVCEHLVNENFFSHIDNPFEKNFEELNKWREYVEPYDQCYDCPLYGDCLRPVHCCEMYKCSENIKKWRIRRYKLGLRRLYLNSNQNKLNDEIL